MSQEYALGPIFAKVGEVITVTLEESPSTGYTVCLTELPGFIALAGDEQFPGVHPAGFGTWHSSIYLFSS